MYQPKKNTLKLDIDKSCVVIGTTGLCIAVLEQLIFNAWRIQYVISDDLAVRAYAAENNLPLLSDLYNVDKTNFVLFSVANPLIISDDFLKKQNVSLAINYHDSLLPKYAGVNSTTWAIYNNEKVHGVSWHLIASGIDEGDLLSQSVIDVAAEETAFSLNLKCFETASIAFADLLINLEKPQIKVSPQDITHKTYYGRRYLPENYALLNCNDNYETINRLFRSLYFGEDNFQNPVASVKIWDGEHVYIVGAIEFQQRDNVIPFHVYSAAGSELCVGIRDGLLKISKLMNSKGDLIALEHTNFKRNNKIQSYLLSEDEKKIVSIMKMQESNVLKIMGRDEYTKSSFFETPLNTKDNKLQFTIDVSKLSDELIIQKIILVIFKLCRHDLCLSIGTSSREQRGISDCAVIRRSFAQKDALRMTCAQKDALRMTCAQKDALRMTCAQKRSDQDDVFTTWGVKRFIKSQRFVFLESDQKSFSFKDFAKKIAEQYTNNYLIPEDFYYRYNLANIEHDVGLYLLNSSTEEAFCFNPSHRLSISIDKLTLTIHGYEEDKVLLNSVVTSIEHVLKKLQPSDFDSKIADIRVVPPAEYNKIVYEWNQTDNDYPLNKTMHELFEIQAEKTPDHIALNFQTQQMSYRELNTRANQLARQIRASYIARTSQALAPDTLIGLCVERGIDMMIGMLGILKAGGAYVPIAPNYPAQRIKFILSDTQTKLILTQRSLATQVANLAQEDVAIRSIDEANLYNSQARDNLGSLNKPTDLAYVIYTSGTTGSPKGVMIEHKGVINLISVLSKAFELTDSNSIRNCLWYANYVFDAHVPEVYTCLLNGHRLHIITDEIRQNLDLLDVYIKDHKINVAAIPPALLNDKSKLALDVLIVAGEKADKKILDFYKQVKIINGYGPTEGTVGASFNVYDNNGDTNIGAPISNVKCYILDADLQPVPMGVAGEIYIGGVGLARGYLNLPTLTEEKFISNVFQTATEEKSGENSRLYKTGDLARWMPDGHIDYIGRTDFQVKIRGYRIELGEIERVLSGYPGVNKSVALVKEHFNQNNRTTYKYLVAFYTADTKLEEELIIQYLNTKIPEYMVPNVLIQIERFLLTINGKLDRTALLAFEVRKKSTENIQPVTDIEKSLCSIWSAVLNVNQICIDDKFFQLGGNSLLVVALKKRLEDIFKIAIGISSIFEYPTIRSYANYIVSRLNKDNQQHPENALVQKKDWVECPVNSTDIAIIGMSCRVPGANNIHEFWHNLESGIESIQNVADDELIASGIDVSQYADINYVRRAANIDSYASFDANFFGYTPREAASMDPQHRHFMEVVWEALEDSGYAPGKYHGQIGLYTGQGENTYYLNHLYADSNLLNDLGDYQLKINNDKDFLSTKISFKLNLKGPSLNIQTACSTSLVTVHIAIQQLLAGDCDIAVAGGVSIAQRHGYTYQKGMVGSSDGVCRAFDKDADGTVVSSGAGAVILKPLAKALKDGDHIYAIIKGTAINNDGANKMSYTAPSINGQSSVVQRALTRAGIDPATISYIEAHGTGTKLGDPIELSALHNVFSPHQQQENSIAIGSVKTNIGHTDAAAGIMGLIKTSLALNYKKIPASLNFKEWNPEITSFNDIFYVNSQLTDWKTTNDNPRRAGVSSFGIGGTNAHVVLEEAPNIDKNKSIRPQQLFLVSAKTETALANGTKQLAHFLQVNPNSDLAGIAYTQHVGREHWKFRQFIVGNTVDSLKDRLWNIPIVAPHNSTELDLVFMFSGQGSQYIKMGLALYQCEPAFSKVVDYCCELLKREFNLDLLNLLHFKQATTVNSSQGLTETCYAQPALFIIEYAMSQLLMSFGIKPKVFIGHSIGEYVAATLSGVFELNDALRLVALRGKLMQSMPTGAMLSVALSYEEIQLILPTNLDVGAINAPKLCVVSGDLKAIKAFGAMLEDKNIAHSRLHTSHAFHSRMMRPLYDDYLCALKKIKKDVPSIPIVSNVTGDWLTPEQAQSDEYWCNHLMMPVFFSQGIKKISKDYPSSLFIEIGPGRTLFSLAKQTLPKIKALITIRHFKQKEDEYETFLTCIGELWKAGYEIDWKKFHEHERLNLVSLPTYCFDHEMYLINAATSPDEIKNSSFPVPVIATNNQRIAGMNTIWQSILGLNVVGMDDDFFELGGHSLLASQLIVRIKEIFDVDFDIKDIFEHSKMQAMCDHVSKVRKAQNKIKISDPIRIKRCADNIYPILSAAQENLWVLHEINIEKFNAYNESFVFKMEGKLSIDVLSQAMSELIERHEILRTTLIRNTAGHLCQKISTHAGFNLNFENVDELAANQLLQEEISRPFNLSTGPLFRVRLFCVGPNKYTLLFVVHHIITDGTSFKILCDELSTIYNAILNSRAANLEKIQVQYVDYSFWQRDLFKTAAYQTKIDYWKKHLAGYQELNLTFNQPRNNIFDYKGSKYKFTFSKELSSQLLKLAKQEKTTLFNIMLAGWSVLLAKYCRQNDVLVGTPMLNRQNSRLNKAMGLFVNTVVLRNYIDKDLSFNELLNQVKENTLNAYANQDVSFNHVVANLNVERDSSRNPLVQAMLIVVHKAISPQLDLQNLNITTIDPPNHSIAKFDVTLGVLEGDDELSGFFEYATDLFNEETIKNLSDSLQMLLRSIADNPGQLVKHLSISDENETYVRLVNAQSNYVNYPITTTIHECFIKQATKTPHAIAVKCGDNQLTYKELDLKSNQLAYYLRERYQSLYKEPMATGSLIGICLERSVDTIVAILGVLKAGAAYVPIDSMYPVDRIEYLILDSNVSLVITQEKMAHLKCSASNKLLMIDCAKVEKEIAHQSNRKLDVPNDPASLAYVIYTSGSTGRPKGVLVPHINVMKLFAAASEHYQFGERDIWTMFHSYAFDFSVWEIWGALLFGGKLIVIPPEISKDANAFYSLSKQEGVTILNQTPSAFRSFIDADMNAKDKIDSLRYVIFGGEALNIFMLKDWWAFHNDKAPLLVNMYGITETTVHVTYQELSLVDLEQNRHGRIGVPLKNLRVYVLDEQNGLSPTGIPGELHIGGDSLARGYLNQEELTKQRFIKNPFAEKVGLPKKERLYKTGDLVRWLPDGSLEYIGRTDFQVKLRGFRIELGEIENALNMHQAIKQAIVILREDERGKYLVGYYALIAEMKDPGVEELRSHLRKMLPEYMVPSALVRLDFIPLTNNGKANRASLPKPDMAEMGSLYTPPKNKIEHSITKIWSELLGIIASKISVTDNYFQLGGNSLSIVTMITKVKQQIHIDLPISAFLGTPTIRAMAKVIDGGSENDNEYIQRVKRRILKDLSLAEDIKPLNAINTNRDNPRKILITGATGFLGSHLLNELCKSKDIEIYCLVRAKSQIEAEEKLNTALIKNQLNHLVGAYQISVICGDFEHVKLNLDDATYNELAENIDAIYHNGALVHHLYDYEHMRTANVLSTHELLTFAAKGKNKAINFISTISVAEFDVKEKLHSADLNYSFFELNGYLLTKWVSEQLILEASRRGISARIFRPGNITGHSETGFCIPEYNHTLLRMKGFIQLGQAYYDENEVLEMMPVDHLATNIVENSLLLQEKVIFNLDNPTRIKLSDYVNSFIKNKYKIDKVKSLATWRKMLWQLKEDNALYLLKAFYEYEYEAESNDEHENSTPRESDLLSLPAVYDILISRQIKYLQEVGFIPIAG